MRYRPLGATGYRVSEVSFGTIPILRGDVPVLPAYFNLTDAQALEVLHHARSQGCNLFDTAIAPEYGDAEEKLGKFLQEVPRQSVVVSDKARFFAGDEMYGAVQQSCETLGGYADLYFVHQVDPGNEEMTFRPYGAIDALCESRAEGRIRLVGVATHYYDILLRAAKDPRVDVLQGSGNILERGMLGRVESEPAFRAKGFLVNKVFAAGVLPQFFSVEELVGGALSYPVSSVVLGLGTHGQVDAAMNREFPQARPPFDNVLLRLGKYFSPLRCDRCQQCRCRHGTEIHIMFRQYNYYFLGKDYWALRKLDLDIRQQAERCRRCSDAACMGSCPRGIDIPTVFAGIERLVSAHIRHGRI